MTRASDQLEEGGVVSMGVGRPVRLGTRHGVLPGQVKTNRVGSVFRTGLPGGRFGTKLTQIVERIQSIDSDDRILVFVQFKDLMQKVAECFEEAGIVALQLKGSVHQKTKALDAIHETTMKKHEREADQAREQAERERMIQIGNSIQHGK